MIAISDFTGDAQYQILPRTQDLATIQQGPLQEENIMRLIATRIIPLLALLVSSGASATTIMPLGFPDLPGLSGERSSLARGISNDGMVIVGSTGAVWPGQASMFTEERAFRWTEATGFQVLQGATAAHRTQGLGVSGDGGTVVGIGGPTGNTPVF